MESQSERKLKTASPAEILRSHQKDNEFISQINETITDLMHRYNLYSKISRFIKLEVPAKMIYFIVTSGLGNQTLGEEYTGLVQANLRRQKVPSIMVRVLAALFECFGEQMLMKLLENLQATINKSDNRLTPRVNSLFHVLFNKLYSVIPTTILGHRGLFYICGRYYSIGRRLTRVDYVKIYGRRSHSSVSWGLRILGFATITQCLFQLLNSRTITENIFYHEKDFENNLSSRCQLCLEKVSDTTTQCGHLFCWICLAEWLQARSRCPLCRESVPPSRIILLMNL